jgi:hypothetical protein
VGEANEEVRSVDDTSEDDAADELTKSDEATVDEEASTLEAEVLN